MGLTFALPKGRLLDLALPLLGAAGIALADAVASAGRRLEVTASDGTRVLLVKPIDVPTYVEYGVADIGIAGSDTLEEQGRDLYEPVDLGIGACRLVVAEPLDHHHAPAGLGASRLRRTTELRVATKYPRLARKHYHSRGIAPEIIPLLGSVELGAVTGLADQIVDLVESGETLRQNRLTEVETIMQVTSRLVVHPASLKLRAAEVSRVIEALRRVVGVSRKASVA